MPLVKWIVTVQDQPDYRATRQNTKTDGTNTSEFHKNIKTQSKRKHIACSIANLLKPRNERLTRSKCIASFNIFLFS